MSATVIRTPRDPRAEADAQQRRAADPIRSVWVSASAGTGKTKVLTDRVLSLLAGGTAPERILCLTFTRAAAAEMANRINEALGRWATMTDDELACSLEALRGTSPDLTVRRRARSLFARVLDTPGGMKIQTIHAFCESLLGRFPLEARLAPHFRIMDERSAAEAMAEARDALIARAREGGDPELSASLDEIAARVTEQQFSELLARLACDHQKLRRLTGNGKGGLERAIRRTYQRLGVGLEETEQSILMAAAAEDAFDGDGLRRAAAAMMRGGKTDSERGRRLAAWLEDPSARLDLFDDYCRSLLKGDGAPYARLATKAVVDAEPAILDVLGTEAQRLVAVCARRNALITARATAALLRLGRGVLDLYDEYKSTHGLLDYDDLILYARTLLEGKGGASWVHYKLDGGIDHILIDEAQDTNPDQWAIVAALTEEFFAGEGARPGARTVFAVGDSKQSIYSFQGADPDAFERMRVHFRERAAAARAAWDSVDLHVSFRSTESVLSAVDAVFAQPGARDGVAGEGERIEHIPYRAGQAGIVELWPPVEPVRRDTLEPWRPPVERRGGDAPAARLATGLAALIRRWIGTEPLPSRGRTVRPGDIMVLVRRRGPFVDELVRALKQRNVPVAGVDRMVLIEQLAVRDLVALGEVLLLPEDDLTLATVLKGPLIGIDEESLYALAEPRGEGETLWSALRARAHERADWRAAHDLLLSLLARADFVPPYELYADVLGRMGGRRRILARLGQEAADPIDEFMGRALEFERHHPPSLQAFLHWIALGNIEVKRDLEQATRDEVRVMTVHGSKGLQAPIVFLPDTMHVPRGNEDVLYWTDDGLMLWPPRAAYREAVAESARSEAERRRLQEYRRLLYVAMTRAEDRLYVCGWCGGKSPPAGTWHELVEVGLKAAQRGDDFAFDRIDGVTGTGRRLENVQIAEAKEEEVRRALHAVPAELPEWALRPAPPEDAPLRPLAPSRPDDDEPATRTPLGDDRGARFRRGILLHRLLQSLPEIAPEKRADAARRFLVRQSHGLAPAEQDALADEVMAVIAAPDHAALFGPGSRAEVPIVGCVGTRVVTGQVDRLVVTDDAVRIVDYKTNRPPPSSPEKVAPLYLRQMAAYRAVLRLIYPGRRIECALLWTDGPTLMVLPDNLLDEHAP